MINVAVIGVGSMGQNHARVYFNSKNANLVAVSDMSPEQGQKIADKYGAKFYSDYKEMLDNESIDAVSIAVPTSLHRDVSLNTLNRKKHILLEKPIASNREEAQEIIDCAKLNDVKLMVGHIERFNSAITELKNRLLQGDLGEIYKVDVQRIGPFPSRITDVGVIIDLSVHDIDIISYLINSEPTRIYAESQQKLHPHHEDSVTALVKYSSGVLAVLNVNYLSPTKIRQLQIFGKKGMFKVNYLDQELYFYENRSFSSDNWDGVSEGDMKKINIPKREPLEAEIESFLGCIIHNTQPLITGEQAKEVLKIAKTLLKSAKENRILL
jgi:UDP-N-acetylglucosamine 3-dehydrogenase